MKPDPIQRIRDELLAGRSVRTELGAFALRTYLRYEGRNPRTGEAVVVPARHIVFMHASPRLIADVLGGFGEEEGPSSEETGGVASRDATFIECGELYRTVVGQLQRTRVTVIDEESASGVAWSEVEPLETVPFGDLGEFAIYRGPADDASGDQKTVTRVVFRQSEALTHALRQQLGD